MQPVQTQIIALRPGKAAFSKNIVNGGEKGPYPEMAHSGSSFAGQVCKGISTKSYIFPDCKTGAKAFPMCLFLHWFRAQRFITGVTNFVRQLQEITHLGHFFAQLFVLASLING
ncbi:hypothetical protein AGR1B_Lc10486 [Agrobacterium fabacearum S56]|nr:hypothetical protein AGR1B_Lc10486 [Agrobacterium fabacearum S56]CUW99499.1 hypothetical protein AGR1C_Lc20294 [Agrobacterium fabacearum TT111]